ncbi:MAG: hypothetical protein ACLU9S_13880 [Oscillospiraceae bacterium]
MGSAFHGNRLWQPRRSQNSCHRSTPGAADPGASGGVRGVQRPARKDGKLLDGEATFRLLCAVLNAAELPQEERKLLANLSPSGTSGHCSGQPVPMVRPAQPGQPQPAGEAPLGGERGRPGLPVPGHWPSGF